MKLAAIAAVALISATTTAAQTDLTEYEWIRSLPVEGWKLTAISEHYASLVYTRPAVSPGPHRKMWLRYEFREPRYIGQTPYLSHIDLYEYDCAQGRQQVLQSSYFAEHAGRSPAATSLPEPWNYPVPGTLAAQAYDVACALTLRK